jgi:hypothetical protein
VPVPAPDLLVEKLDVVGLPDDGNLLLDPPLSGLSRVLLRRLYCWLRVPPVPGVRKAVLDTGAPLTLFPYQVWKHDFGWQPGRDFDELSLAGVGTTLTGQVLGHRFSCRLARLRVPVELAGSDLKAPRLRLDSLICQLADAGGPSMIILGLWGGIFTDHRLVVESAPNSDDIQARLEF